MAQRVSRGIALLFHDRGTRRGQDMVHCNIPEVEDNFQIFRVAVNAYQTSSPIGQSGVVVWLVYQHCL